MSAARKFSDAEYLDMLMRNDFSSFAQRSFLTLEPSTDYKHNWHLDCLADYATAVHDGDMRRLIVNIPPRTLKSILFTVAFTAWVLGKNPAEQIIAASYAERLAVRHSVNTRRIMESQWYMNAFPRTRLSTSQNQKIWFNTTENGHRIATTVGGTATGEGGNYLIVDDPTNPKQALSDAMRVTANTWFDQTLFNRQNDPKTGKIIVVMQRLHTDDLSGHLLDLGGWEHVSFPMEAESATIIDFGRFKDRPIKRQAGELLHPERFGPDEVEEYKTTMGSYGYAGQYQQRPVPKEGGTFHLDWFKRYKTPPTRPEVIKVIQSWDTASKDSEIHDFSVCSTWLLTRKALYLVDVYRARINAPTRRKQAISFWQRWASDAVLIEDKGSGIDLIQELKECPHRIPVIAFDPGNQPKAIRHESISPQIEAGLVYLPESASWLADFEAEVGNTPNAANDDQVDSMYQVVKWAKPQKRKSTLSRNKGTSALADMR